MQGYLQRRKVYVFDTAAFIAALQLMMYGVEIYTTSSVIAEVKDSESVQRLELSQPVGRVSVVDPEKMFVEKATEVAKRFGLLNKLSKTDIDVIALALQLKEQGYSVTVLTDDYDIQNILQRIGIDFTSVKTVGIKRRK
jgi:UPF0271 protein